MIWVSSSALSLGPYKSYCLGAGGGFRLQKAHSTPDVPGLMRPDTRGCESKTGQKNHTQVRTREIKPLPVSSHPPQSAGLARPTPEIATAWELSPPSPVTARVLQSSPPRGPECRGDNDKALTQLRKGLRFTKTCAETPSTCP